MSPNGIIDLNSLTAFRSQRFDDQVSSNPYFFNGPFTGVLVQPAAYTFIYRFMANHSVEAPHGELRSEVLQSWFGVEEEEEEGGEYVWREGWERIPLNWVSTYLYLLYLLRLLPTLSMQAPFAYLISNMRKKTVQTSHRIPLRQRLFPRRCRQRCSSPSQISQYWRVSLTYTPLLISSLPTTNSRPPLFSFLTETPTAPTPSQASTSPLSRPVFSPRKISLPKRIVLLVLLINLLRKLNRIYLVLWMSLQARFHL